jgi:hypothetical protein
MRHSIKQLVLGLTLSLASLAVLGVQSLAQSTPQQVMGSNWQALSTTAPAVATGGTNEYIAWMGLNNKVYFAVFNGSTWTDHQIVGGSGWTAETSASPALVYVYANDVWLAWKGKSSNVIWYSIWNGTSWSTQQKVSGSGWTAETSSAPSLALFQNTVYLAWQGDGAAESIWDTYYSEEGWGAQQTVGGSGWTASTSAGPSLNNFQFEPTIMYLFWRDKSTGYVWETSGETPSSSSAISWGDPADFSLGAATNVGPASVAFPTDDGDLVVFYTSTSNEVAYLCATSSGLVKGSGWSAETDAAPAAASATLSILAWKNATDDTIWFLNPTTVPGISPCG